MPPRPRSSTVSSTHSSRSFVASNPESLLPASTTTSNPFALQATDEHGGALEAARSYRSEHSLRTLRGRRDGEGDSIEDEGGEGDSGITLSGAAHAHARTAAVNGGLEGRRVGPQFVIDLDGSGGGGGGVFSSSASGTTGGGGRPRSDTFGGVPLPPSQLPPAPSGELPPPASARPSLGHRARSTSLSSLRSLDPDLHLGGAPLRERRPVLYAGLQAAALLAVSLLAVVGLLYALLPPIEEEHREAVKLPRSFEDLKRLNEVYRARHNYRVMGCYVIAYFFLQAFSIPGSMYLSILGGALWGVAIALPLVCFCVATGASFCYLMSALLGPAVLLHSEVWQRRVEAWSERVKEHRANLISYLVILRIAPLPPHWVVNCLAYHMGIDLWTFWISTALGIAGVSYIHTQIGTTLDQMTSSEDFHLISWKNGLGLGGIILAVLIPVLLRRYFASDIAAAAAENEPGGTEPTEPLLHPRASLSLDEEAPLAARARISTEGRGSTDGSARLGGGGVGYRDFAADEEGSASAGGRPVLKPGGGSADKVSRVLGVQVGGH